MRTSRPTALAAALAIILASSPGGAQQAADPDQGLQYLLDTRSQSGYGTWTRLVAEAAAQAGYDIKNWPSQEDAIYDALEPTPRSQCPAEGPTYNVNLRLAHAVGTSGYDPRDVHGVNLYACVRAGFDGTQSGDPQTINDDVWTILALRAGGVGSADNQMRSSADVIKLSQRIDGGWSYNNLGQSSTDVTGMALAALAAANDLPPGARANALGFLDSTYDPATGGHRDLPNGGVGPNCQSTLWAIHGYNAAGAAVRQDSLDYLAALQNADGGFARRLGGESDAFCTAEAVPIAAGSLQLWPRFAPGSAGGGGDPYRDVRQAWRVISDVPGDLVDAIWTIRAPSGKTAAPQGQSVEHQFSELGRHEVLVHATGPGTVMRDQFALVVENRLPSLSNSPALMADRTTPFRYDPQIIDTDDATVATSWTLHEDGAATHGTGGVLHAFTKTGFHLLSLQLDDGHDQVTRQWTIQVVNLPPRVLEFNVPQVAVAGQAFNVSAAASDADGPPPALQWITPAGQADGAAASVRLGAGEHVISLRATDADGAVIWRHATVLVKRAPTPAADTEPESNQTIEPVDPDPSLLADPKTGTGAGTGHAQSAAQVGPLDAVGTQSLSAGQEEKPAPGPGLAALVGVLVAVQRRLVPRA